LGCPGASRCMARCLVAADRTVRGRRRGGTGPGPRIRSGHADRARGRGRLGGGAAPAWRRRPGGAGPHVTRDRRVPRGGLNRAVRALCLLLVVAAELLAPRRLALVRERVIALRRES